MKQKLLALVLAANTVASTVGGIAQPGHARVQGGSSPGASDTIKINPLHLLDADPRVLERLNHTLKAIAPNANVAAIRDENVRPSAGRERPVTLKFGDTTEDLTKEMNALWVALQQKFPSQICVSQSLERKGGLNAGALHVVKGSPELPVEVDYIRIKLNRRMEMAQIRYEGHRSTDPATCEARGLNDDDLDLTRLR